MNKVAVIGAGAAGLCTARHLLRVNIQPVIFEQKECVGGTWAYQDVDLLNLNDVFSSMYLNMKTNLPKQVMLFPDFEFADSEPSFMHHTSVQKYLIEYAKHFKLYDYIRFKTKVTSVSPLTGEYNEDLGAQFIKWNIESCNNNNISETTSECFDAVVVCNGHYTIPTYPNIKDMCNFTGNTLHSHYYRRPEDYNGQNVLILGAGPSGRDIALELSKECDTVYLSHKGMRFQSQLPLNVKEVLNISHVTRNGDFVFEDGGSVTVDTFIPCTGYKYDIPFLTSDSGIKVEDRIVRNLYKHLFNIKYPSMSLVGIPWKVAPFPVDHQQCAYLSSIYSGKQKLPSEDEMLTDTNEEHMKRLSRGEPDKYFHRMNDMEQFRYNDELAYLSGFSSNPAIIENLYGFTAKCRSADLQNYKNMEFKRINDQEFKVL